MTSGSHGALLVLLTAAGAWPFFPCRAETRVADYERAERLLSWNVVPLVGGDRVEPHWIGKGRVWYRNSLVGGHEYVVVDMEARTRRPAFDHARLAAALSARSDANYVPQRLPLEELEWTTSGTALQFLLAGAEWRCDLNSYDCAPMPSLANLHGVRSPDRRWLAFERDWNLWLRDLSSGVETRLSADGTEYYGYARPPEECCDVITERLGGSKRTAILAWSADSKKIVTYRLDERNVQPMYLLQAAPGRPMLHSYRYALPGDAVIPTYELFVFDLDTRRRVRIDTEPLALLRARDELMVGDTWLDCWFDRDGRSLFFVAAQRANRHMELRRADTSTGFARVILNEEAKTAVAPPFPYGPMIAARRFDRDGRGLWWSDRDGWGHLYMYATRASNGTELSQLTRGHWLVHDVVHVNAGAGWIYFTASGREAGRNPYFRHLYRIGSDGSGMTLLTPEDSDHTVWMSPDGAYIIDTSSRVDGPAPTSVVRDRDGHFLMALEKADVSRLLGSGWRWPVPFTVKARDGTTDVWGLMYLPQNYDAAMKYPVIDAIYPGPSAGGVRRWDFDVDTDRQAMAELGFVVIAIDAMGTPGRSRAFWDVWFSDIGDPAGIGEFGILDHIAALRQLAERHPQMDLTRVGVWGHSGGGGAALNAMLRFPELFKVGVASAGNHDSRGYAYDWGEKWQGALTHARDDVDTYSLQDNQRLADGLKGKLLLAYSGMDDNVHPNLSWLVINQLIQRNKDFDLIVVPNSNHSFNHHPYMIRRTWDFFVRHLRGEEPPANYSIQAPNDISR